MRRAWGTNSCMQCTLQGAADNRRLRYQLGTRFDKQLTGVTCPYEAFTASPHSNPCDICVSCTFLVFLFALPDHGTCTLLRCREALPVLENNDKPGLALQGTMPRCWRRLSASMQG